MRKRQRKRFDHGEPIAKIDTRPLAFVAMFLAIVFLIPAAQVKPHVLNLDLVSAYDRYFSHQPDPIVDPEAVIISPTETGEILWNCQAVSFERFSGLVQELVYSEPVEPILIFHPAPNASYDLSAKARRVIKGSGATKLRFEGLEDHRHFTSERQAISAGGGSSLSVLLSRYIVELPEKLQPKPIAEINCGPGER